jgi:dTDP-4-dehydrorhamnose reductase
MHAADIANAGPVWITGAGGLIGNCLLRTAPHAAPGVTVAGLIRRHLDLTDFAGLRQEFLRGRPQAVIHCAALSRSPECQSHPALARKVNVEVTAVLAELAAEIPFVLFSTDLVFDGKAGNYAESAPVNPLSVYAETKVAAEQIVLKNPRHTVIRTSLSGGTSPTGDRGFNEQMRLSWQNGQSVRLFTDEFRSPIAAEVTATATWELLAARNPGLYHLAGTERLSRWQIGQLVAARWPSLNPKIESASLKEYPGAPRPPDTSLNSEKIQRLLTFRLPGLSQWLTANPALEF